jgi:DNA end-binding protein Ku
LREVKAKTSRRQGRAGKDFSHRNGRPFWSGTITFGLVSIPVNLFPANQDSRMSLRMTSKGKYVTVTEEELERLAPEKSRDINLRVFVPRNDISPSYFEKGYVLTPADKAGNGYRLLAKTMEVTDRAGIATFVMHGKEYLVAIIAVGGILRAESLRFRDEIRKPPDVGLPKKKPSAREVRTFDRAITRLFKKTLDLSEMRDVYSERMLKLIEKKRREHENVAETTSPGKKPAQVVDLTEILKRSLAED